MRSSLSRNFLLGVGVTSVVFTITAALATFAVFQSELAHRQISFLSQYVQERTDNLDRRFSNLQVLQQSAVTALNRRESLMTDGEAQMLLDADLPLRADGTRRSPPDAFFGEVSKGRHFVIYGMGAFIADGAHIPRPEARALAAAYPIVGAFGQAAHGQYDNFYFFTPHNRVVMFGPDRSDHLKFYRETAPADLDFSHEEMARLMLPAVNPERLTRCTSLQRLIQESVPVRRVGTACVTPAYVDGRLVGAFGSTLNLTTFFADAMRATLPGANALIVRSDGALIADASSMAGASEDQVAEQSRRLGVPALVRRVRAAHGDHGVVLSAKGDQIVAYGRLSGPNWYFLLTYPSAAVAWSAFRSASVVLILGAIASLLQTLVILRMAKRAIVRPLQDLARSCDEQDSPHVAGLDGRRDEIGVLARALAGERDRADELLSSLEERVRERTAELEKANAEKSRFLANMSHELRTPLNGVIAVSETLAREQTTQRNCELAQLIVASGRLLEQVLTDILDFSKIEAGEMRVESHPFDLVPVVSRVAELHRVSAEAKGVQLIWSVTPEAAGAYLGDPVRLTQVLSNLLSNAVKFTAAGRVSLCVSRPADALLLEVSDTGIGFDEEAKGRLFHRFEQADVSIRRRFGGTGLGLAICRSLIELMGGEIDARSAPGQGATFSVRLPLPAAELETSAPVEADTDAAALTAARVLLAEDHPTNQRVVRLILESVGVELSVVENGALALEASAVETFDVILMDMQMPEMDGLTATALIRAREAETGQPRTPIIMLTANALDEHIRASLAAGADLHLSKPLRAAELLEAVGRLAGGDDPSDVEVRPAA